MQKGTKIGADVAPIFLLLSIRRIYGLDFWLVSYLPWIPKIDQIFGLLESLWQSSF